MEKSRLSKQNIALLCITAIIIIGIAIFAALEWKVLYNLLDNLIHGAQIVKGYILNLGWIGVVAMILIIMICYFFPFISSIPIQIACAITYGIGYGMIIVCGSISLASQILFLLKKNILAFQSNKKQKERNELRDRIKKSKYKMEVAIIIAYFFPLIPFIVVDNVASIGLKYWKYLIISTIGPIASTYVTLKAGQVLLQTSPIGSLIMLIILFIMVILSFIYSDKIVNKIFPPKE